MDRVLRPEKFDCDPNSPDASRNWKYWFTTFNNYLDSIDSLQPDKLKTLINFISPKMYEHISDYNSYELAVSALESLYVRPKNEVFARYTLISCKQESGQDCNQFLQKLHSLAKDCNFLSVTGDQYRNDYIRDAFVSGLSSNFIRQRLLELPNLDLQQAANTAFTLEMAQSQSASYHSVSINNTCGATTAPTTESTSVAAVPQPTCFSVVIKNIYVSIVLLKMPFVKTVEKRTLSKGLSFFCQTDTGIFSSGIFFIISCDSCRSFMSSKCCL